VKLRTTVEMAEEIGETYCVLRDAEKWGYMEGLCTKVGNRIVWYDNVKKVKKKMAKYRVDHPIGRPVGK